MLQNVAWESSGFWLFLSIKVTHSQFSCKINGSWQPGSTAGEFGVCGAGCWAGSGLWLVLLSDQVTPDRCCCCCRAEGPEVGVCLLRESWGGTWRNPEEPGGTWRNPEEPGGTWRNPEEPRTQCRVLYFHSVFVSDGKGSFYLTRYFPVFKPKISK